MHEKTIDLSFYSDGLKLNGVLHLPFAETPPVIVGSHGLASDGDSPKQIELARVCTGMGMAYFRFHHRGCGSSEGFFPEVTTLENRVRDLTDAVKTVIDRSDTGDRLALFGSSMGGTTCIAAAPFLKPEAMVTVAAPVLGKVLTKPPERGPGDPELDEAFFRRFLDFDIRGTLPLLHRILIFHGESDDVVPMDSGTMIYDKAGEPKRLIIQKKGDHRISLKAHQEEFIRESSLWFKNCFFQGL